MLARRIIPCLDVRNGRVVKGVQFEGLRDVDDPVTLAAFYNVSGADELVFYDITASYEDRGLFQDVLRRVAREVFIPLTVGGGIREVKDFEMALKNGADKVSVNSAAIKNPMLIKDAARHFGDQCVVLSMDVKRVNGRFRVFGRGGRDETDIDAIEWAKRGQDLGAGEIVLNSIDTDGVRGGFDIEMLNAVSSAVSIPIVASGGAGCKEDFVTLFKNAPGADAGLAASIFHSREVDIHDLKELLFESGIPVRRTNHVSD
ncbi:MAG: imidazole glycerol phosphate synthase subunit HisF [Clostridia bacterium]|nr:imidazole glycerol phosphate synthase subunit HisF [Clostridia bacterium]